MHSPHRLVALLGLTVCHSQAADDSVLYWASSGGGWRSMVANMGYANAFHRAGLLSEFDVLSSTSGGAWFQQQLLFSQPYFDRITVDDPTQVAEFAVQWLVAFATGIVQPSDVDARCDALVQAAALIPELEFLVQACAAFAPMDWDFASFIQKMFNDTATTYGDPGFGERPLSPEHRVPALSKADFYVQMALAANARVIHANTTVFLGPASDPTLDYSVPLPVQYVVKGNQTYYAFAVDDAELPLRTRTDSDTPATIDTADWADFHLFPPPSNATEFRAAASRKSFESTSSSVVGQFREPFAAQDFPSVTQIAAATSSASADIAPSVPSMFAQRLSQVELSLHLAPNVTQEQVTLGLNLVDKAYNTIWQTPLFRDFAVCSQWPAANCGLQDGRLMDGGHADFHSVAQTIGQYQMDGDPNKTLKIILTNNNNVIFGNQDVLSYFNTTFYNGVGPGDFYWPIDPATGPYPTPRKSIQIFDEFLDDETLLAAFEPIQGTNLTTAVYYATTIDNPDFKVQAGWKVELMLLQINSDIPTLFDPTFIPNMGQLAGTVAGQDELVRRLQDFANVENHAPDVEQEMPEDETFQEAVCVVFFVGPIFCFLRDLFSFQ